MLNSLKLKNFKSHHESEFQFKPKANILLGPMGAGKSSILQAMSFALFGTFSELKSRELKVSDLLSRGSDLSEGEVELSFTGPDSKELIVRRLIQQNKSTEASIRTKEGKLLAGPSSTEVTNYVKDILKLDEDVFLRTIYAKQNEFDLFLRLSPNDRKEKLDELMGIHRFETARKNCVTVLNKISEKRKMKDDFIKNIDAKKLASDIATLDTDMQKLKNEIAALAEQIETVLQAKNNKKEVLDNLRTANDNYNKLTTQRNILKQNLAELAHSLKDFKPESDSESASIRLRDIAIEINESKNNKAKTNEDYERNQSSMRLLEKQLGGLEEKSRDLLIKLKQSGEMKKKLLELEREGNLETLNEKVRGLGESLELENNKKQALKTEIGIIEKHMSELEKMEGVCPVCSTKLEEEQKKILVAQRKNKLDELRSVAESAVLNTNAIKNQIEWIDDIREQLKIILVKMQDYDDLRQKERDVAIQLSEVKGRRAVFLDTLKQVESRMNGADTQIEKLNVEQKMLTEQKRLYDVKLKQDDLAMQIQNIESELKQNKIDAVQLKKADEEFQTAIRDEQAVLERKNSIGQLIDEKEKRRVEFIEKKEQVDSVLAEIAVLDKNIEFLSQFRNALLTTQESLRKDLILAVNEIMSSVWLDLYPYEKFSAIKLNILDSDYELQLKDKTDWVSVAGFASGGERMLACLTLHIAFARIMSPNLNILILDEPTHNLDAEAIDKLIEIVQEKLANTLDQIFIVTHDEKLGEIEGNVIRLGSKL